MLPAAKNATASGSVDKTDISWLTRYGKGLSATVTNPSNVRC